MRAAARSFIAATVLLILSSAALLTAVLPSPPPLTIEQAAINHGFDQMGKRPSARLEACVAITDGTIRPRRRHENDMDFSKYNPFYWEGRMFHFRVEDHTPTGRKEIRFYLVSDWPQVVDAARAPSVRLVYFGDPLKHETVRSKFRINARMTPLNGGLTEFEYIYDDESFRYSQGTFPELGELLHFEFQTYNREDFEPWARQKVRNPHNISVYYSEFFRILVGQPGLWIDNFQEPHAPPPAKRYTGGWTTTVTTRTEPWRALQQQATNLLAENIQPFLLGRTWFHTDLLTGVHIEDHDDDKPSRFFPEMEEARSGHMGGLYNERACKNCHVRNAYAYIEPRGDASPVIHTTIARTYDPRSGGPHPHYGRQLQTAGHDSEDALRVRGFDRRKVSLDDGTVITLSMPRFEIDGASEHGGVSLSVRRPPSLIGLGLLEAVPEQTLLHLESLSDGQVGRVGDAVGRFGWKAETASIREQIEGALLLDMGVKVSPHSALDTPYPATQGKGPLPVEAVDQLEAYIALLGTPPRHDPFDPEVERGEAIFFDLNCQGCHFPTLHTGEGSHPEVSHQTIHPYTDLLLHDMGEGLADDTPRTDARLWRTAPLWGLKDARNASDHMTDRFSPGDQDLSYVTTQLAASLLPVQLLHDGRANSIAEAILWHGGEAEPSVDAYKALSKAERDALEAFVLDL